MRSHLFGVALKHGRSTDGSETSLRWSQSPLWVILDCTAHIRRLIQGTVPRQS